MPVTPTRFDDGTAYERMMGRWSQLAGESFLDWLALDTGLRWLDVGCGNGAPRFVNDDCKADPHRSRPRRIACDGS